MSDRVVLVPLPSLAVVSKPGGGRVVKTTRRDTVTARKLTATVTRTAVRREVVSMGTRGNA